MAKSEQLPRLIKLLRDHRWAALATLGDDGNPEASMVAYVSDAQQTALNLHLSQLATHSRNLQRQPEASLVISETDTGDGDPQQLARLTLFGRVSLLERNQPEYEKAKHGYLQRLPTATPLFDFADFRLFRFVIHKARFVGGFAQAHSYNATDLEKAWKGTP